MRNPAAPPSFAALVQSFFAEHLTQQRALSARTVAAYRDAFMLFLEFAQARLHTPPTSMLLVNILRSNDSLQTRQASSAAQ